jgi:RNA polymerase sigma-70 factor, ECF subfamily
MSEFPETRNSLLLRMQSPLDEDAWTQFVAIYRPLLYRLARKRGLQDADAEDLAQRVVLSVRNAIGNWHSDPAKGRFRSWLAKIARNAAINAITRRPIDLAAGGSGIHDLLEELPQPDRLMEETLQLEHRRSLFRWAAQRIRPEFHDATWNAFCLTTVEGIAVEEAAQKLDKNTGSIYAARSRVMRRLKNEIEQSGFGDCPDFCGHRGAAVVGKNGTAPFARRGSD